MRTILRRRPAEDDAPQVVRSIRFGAFVFDLEGERLVRHGEPLHLTTAEASLLKAFAEQAGRTLSREQLIEASRIEGNARTVDVQVTRLRRKIEADPSRSEEHTSELQSLMRTSYAVFCLIKKKEH